MMDVKRFKEVPVMGILRGVEAGMVGPLIETAAASGLTTLEITMNTKDAPALIRKAVEASRGRLMIGAGTVLTAASLKAALDAGAGFIVTPVIVDEVNAFCAKEKIPFFPGALTPLEIHRAWSAGAAMVKVFPAKCFGPAYFKEIKGPFSQIELLACGGVTADNMGEYLSNGASAVAFGAGVFREEWLRTRDLAAIGAAITRFVSPFLPSR